MEKGGGYVGGDDLGGEGARVEAGLVDVGELVGIAGPAELGADDAMVGRVEVELWVGV